MSNLFNAARKICESFIYDPGHSDLDNEQPIAIHCTLGDWRRLNSALMLAGQRAEPEARRIHENAVYQEFLHRAFTQDYASDFIDAAKARDKQPLPQKEQQ
jgi:hypothetical protein